MVLLEILEFLFASIWRFFTGVNVPGLNVPFSALLVGVILARFSVALLSGGLRFGNGTSSRSGFSRNVKISENRKGDEY